ncbi:3beta-hydroxysteroid-dehydrogenase/decarboxylase [Telopea speciosissima]|uniref:3beta-hydroxysteroid- dehydrogenase/decarboxylase n=1 Tax=Telopea speciosissima TaxID=54955 RepID=UPI001CC62E4D|nr:3beta-hydroxysteroid-dehydrogenase/decarboxylase [Telopea speciosissima]
MAMLEGSIDENPGTCTVLSGRSFIGRSLVLKLLKSKKWIVRIADSASSLNLDLVENSVLSDAILTGHASYFQVDVREKSQIIRAIEGSCVVFHVDATDLTITDFYHQYMINVQGTKNVISACRECRVKRLIYNSSADVVFDGIHDICDGDESMPLPWRFSDTLSELKAQAEGLVLFANTIDGLLTCVLRPSNVFGPGDTYLVSFLVKGAKSGWAKFIVGNGKHMCDFTYVENVAHAHITAEEALCSRVASVAGKAFFITNLQPMKSWDFLSLMLEGLGPQRPTIHLPAWMVWSILVLVKWALEKVGDQRNAYSLLTPALFQLLSRTRTFNCSNAQKHFGYSPIVSLDEGIALTVESFLHLAEESPSTIYQDLSEPSKADRLLGSGKVADILLWRDEKKTFTYFLALVLLFYWYLLSGRTFISSTAKLMLLLSVILFCHGFLPSTMFGFPIQRMSSSYFEISETTIKDAFMPLASLWNRWALTLKSFSRGGDWNTFFKVGVYLYFLKLLLSFSFSAVVGVALVLAFTIFFLYEQYEEELDRLMESSSLGLKKLKGLLIRSLPVSLASFLHDYMGKDEVHDAVKDHKF